MAINDYGAPDTQGNLPLERRPVILSRMPYNKNGAASLGKYFGARGYVFKSATGEELIPAIHAVAAGRRWIPQNVAARLRLGNSFEALTTRELEVLAQLARGQANKEIADTLGITEYTTKGHLKSILAKLRVADRTQAVIAAVQRGLIHY